MSKFVINGQCWRLKYVSSHDRHLIDRTGVPTLGTTDPRFHRLYLCKELDYYTRKRVLMHELSHCVMISYGLIEKLHVYVRPEYWFEAEEDLCNFIADYSEEIQHITSQLMYN